MAEQRENLRRVATAIGPLVEAFCCDRWRQDRPAFVIAELTEYVRANSPTAPASPDRILRQLRAEGRIAYIVTCRHQSRYLLTAPPVAARKKQALMW